MEAEYQICKDITFISEEQIHQKYWKEAHDLVHDIDIKDIQYVAYANNSNVKYGQATKLFKGLKEKGFVNMVTTDDLFELRSKRSR